MCVTHEDEDEAKRRKERVLHTRVPAVLEQELKRLADTLRVPVSNVVRVILEDAVDTVDVVGRKAEGELRDVAERLSRERTRMRKRARRRDRGAAEDDDVPPVDSAPRAPLENVIGFATVRLHREHACAVCGGSLAPGAQAHLAVRDGGGPRIIVGPECLPKIDTPAEADEGEQP